MIFNYDRVAHATYLKLSKGKVLKTIQMDGGVLIDIGVRGKVIGIEILNCLL